MNDSERATLIQTLMKAPETVLQINYVDQYLKSSRFAFRVTCDDNNDYVVKGIPTSHCQRQSRRLYGRELFMEQLVARLMVPVSERQFRLQDWLNSIPKL